MSQYTAVVSWSRGAQDFLDNGYSRGHTWEFDGGVKVPASASPHVVPLPLSVADAVDPEEAFVAALASCHMLFFLAIAARRRLVVDNYRDEAVGVMEKNAEGKMAMTRVTLRPSIVFGGDRRPTAEEIGKIHHLSHEQCYIANSVRTEVTVEPAG